MARTFAHGEQIVRPTSTFQGQQNDTAQQQRTSRDQRRDRSTPSWENRGPAWEAWEGDTPPPIPEHLKSDDWIDQHYGAPQSDQKNSSSSLAAKSNTEAVVATNLKPGTSIESEDNVLQQTSPQSETSDVSGQLQPQTPQVFAGIPPKPAQLKSSPPKQVNHASSTAQDKQKQRDAAIKKMSYGDKLVNAAKMVPDLLKGDAKAAYQKMISDPGFVGQLVAVSAIFTAVQFTPAGPFVNGALLATLGISAGFDLYNFLTKVGSAQDGKGLKNAAGYLTSLVETIGIAAVSGALRTASRALGAIKADTSTAAVWKAIKATQPVYGGTLIPKSFELAAGNRKLWVAPNATDHLRELVQGYIKSRGSSQNAEKYTQFLMADFKNSVDQALRQVKIPNAPGMPRQAIRVGNWDLVIGPPRQAGQLPVILHAQPMGNIYMP
jgi:hypothetical protein